MCGHVNANAHANGCNVCSSVSSSGLTFFGTSNTDTRNRTQVSSSGLAFSVHPARAARNRRRSATAHANAHAAQPHTQTTQDASVSSSGLAFSLHPAPRLGYETLLAIDLTLCDGSPEGDPYANLVHIYILMGSVEVAEFPNSSGAQSAVVPSAVVAGAPVFTLMEDCLGRYSHVR